MITIENKTLLSQTVAEAITKAHVNHPRNESLRDKWITALAKATAFLDETPQFSTFNAETKTVTVWSDSDEFYTANGSCECRAAKFGRPCWHVALALIVSRYMELDAAGLTPEGVRFCGRRGCQEPVERDNLCPDHFDEYAIDMELRIRDQKMERKSEFLAWHTAADSTPAKPEPTKWLNEEVLG